MRGKPSLDGRLSAQVLNSSDADNGKNRLPLASAVAGRQNPVLIKNLLLSSGMCYFIRRLNGARSAYLLIPQSLKCQMSL